MVKMHKLTKGGQTIYPATITDAVVNPKTRKSLATEISEIRLDIISQKKGGISLIVLIKVRPILYMVTKER